MIQSLKINKIYFLLPTDQIISCGGREKSFVWNGQHAEYVQKERFPSQNQ